MGDKTGIQWTDATWNPLRGCSRVSKGCENCYAEKVAHRFSGSGQPYEGLIALGKKGARWNGKISLVPEKLNDPLRWTRPRMVFVNSMSDLFHENVSNEYIAAVFGVMAAAKTHTFQVLTKRPQRMLKWFDWIEEKRRVQKDPLSTVQCVYEAQQHSCCNGFTGYSTPWPLKNVWLGVSCEDQETADSRMPLLMECPAIVRWASFEPALGPANFNLWPLDWIVVGGESGPGSRSFDWRWAQNVVENARGTGTRVFVKQLGSKPVLTNSGIASIKDYKGSNMSEWPEVLKIRNYPG
jgi:protein gp37